jgi:uncharacterized protein
MKTPPPLTDADINDIDMLLGAVPAPFETVDAVILDGYLAGVLVQPVMLTPEQYWLPPIFGTEGMPEPGIEGWTEAQHDKPGRPDRAPQGRDPARHPGRRLVRPHHSDDRRRRRQAGRRQGRWKASVTGPPALSGLWPTSHSWKNPALAGVPDLLDSIWRHLPEQDETQQEMTKALDRRAPASSNLDEGIEAAGVRCGGPGRNRHGRDATRSRP